MKYLFVILVSGIFFGCGVQKEIQVKENVVIAEESELDTKDIVIEDLVTVPQNISYYTKDITAKEVYDIQKKYELSYFSVWDMNKPSQTLEEMQWSFRAFNASKSYGENLLPLKQEFFDAMYVQSNFDAYATLNQKALTLRHTDFRAFPTSRPLLLDPSIAGEGFPFDYLQNSSVNANVPLFLSHYSKDKEWVFASSGFTYGWIKTSDVAFIQDKHAQKWKDAQQIRIIEEGVPIYNKQGNTLFTTRIGMLFALIGEDDNNYTILTVSSYKNKQAMFHKSKISKSIASKDVLVFNKQNIEKIINEVSKTNYGWGGMYGQRDCSSTLMDLYTPFGIWLPRNSSKQSEVGKVFNLKELNDKDKVALIKEEAIPFETLLYRKGHIVLYVGIYNGEIIVFQNVWGIRTIDNEEEGRFIIGRPVFSTLKFGDELKNYDENAELLRNIESMNIITR